LTVFLRANLKIKLLRFNLTKNPPVMAVAIRDFLGTIKG
jgi:hypothetical protein